LWRKGETSGDVLDLVDVSVNCEQNSLLYRVRRRAGGACHTRDASGQSRRGCYYRRLVDSGAALEVVWGLPAGAPASGSARVAGSTLPMRPAALARGGPTRSAFLSAW